MQSLQQGPSTKTKPIPNESGATANKRRDKALAPKALSSATNQRASNGLLSKFTPFQDAILVPRTAKTADTQRTEENNKQRQVNLVPFQENALKTNADDMTARAAASYAGIKEQVAQIANQSASKPSEPAAPMKRLAQALGDFAPTKDDHLALKTSEIVEIVDSTKRWWIVFNSSKEKGRVPSNFLKVSHSLQCALVSAAGACFPASVNIT